MAFAFILDSVGAGEWFVLLAVLLVVMGPKRLPATARTIGSYYAKFRRAAETFKRQLMDMDWEMERELEKAKREAEEALSVPEDPAYGPEPRSDERTDEIYPDYETGMYPQDEDAAGQESENATAAEEAENTKVTEQTHGDKSAQES